MPSNTAHSESTSSELVSALLFAARALVEYLSSQGITEIPNYQFEAHWFEPVDESRSRARTAVYTAPDLGALFVRHGEKLKSLTSIDEFGEKLHKFADEHGGYPVSSWIRGSGETANMVLSVYLRQSGGLVVDESVAKHVIQEYLTDIAAPTITARSLFLAQKFSAMKPFMISDEILLRPISEDDIKEHARFQLVPHPYREPWLDSRDWICEVNRRGPRDTYEAVNWHHEGIRYIAATLALVSDGKASFTLLSSRLASRFMSSGTTSSINQTLTGPSDHSYDLTEPDIDMAQRLYPRVVSIFTDARLHHLKLPLGRFLSAAQRTEPEDRVVDCVVGLKRLLSPDSPQLETTIRFRLRGAAILPTCFGGHRERIDLMNDLYRLRSDIVHGSAEQIEVIDGVSRAADALRHVLRWYMNDSRWSRRPEEVVRELDEAMVRGGVTWAYHGPEPVQK